MSYVLITPVRNEERFIEETLRSVVAQTFRPAEWVIVSDRSTDRTDEIVMSYAERHPFIRFVRNPEAHVRDFASQIVAVKAGLRALRVADYAYIGILDGDIRLDPDYYERMLAYLAADEKLGLVGGALLQSIGDRFVDQKISEDSVAGGVQLFRRESFEAIGGYIPMPKGGTDSVAEVMVRMHGWRTRTFREPPFYHLKPMNSATGVFFYTKWQVGERDYLIGNHPLFEVFRCVYRAREPPLVISSLIRFTAYMSMWLRHAERPISEDVVRFKQGEQRQRLKALIGIRAKV